MGRLNTIALAAMALALAGGALTGCKYYGSALPPEYPMSMDSALDVARTRNVGPGGQAREIVRHPARPQINRPAYLPEKELAVVAPPRTLLVWSYPHVTDENTRVFGSWSTIFLTDRYEWVPPANEVPIDSTFMGVTPAGNGGMGASGGGYGAIQ